MGAISNDWLGPMSAEFKKPYYRKLYETVKHEYETKQIFPDANDIFNAFEFTPLSKVKAVILGQDPYHNVGQAHGLCFSVKPDVEIPPSLMNIYQELHDDLGCYIPNNGYLKSWADQGVLLLNASLTVVAGQANSHSKIGWQQFTDKVIQVLNDREDPVIFILWGGNARSKKKYITHPWHYIIESAHPSPLSASNGFFGSKPFSKTNQFLEAHGLTPIDWQIEDVER